MKSVMLMKESVFTDHKETEINMIREIAVADIETIEKAIKAGVERVELSADLSVGGITPSVELVQEALALTNAAGIDLVVMVRPRGGDFVYSHREISSMIQTLKDFRELGVHYVTFGALDAAGHLDRDGMVKLLESAKPMQVVFHMAYDDIKDEYQEQSLQWLARHHVIRVLTHGGQLDESIVSCLPRLQQSMHFAPENLIILPGGGITFDNADMISEVLNVSEVHGSRIVRM